MKPEVFKINNMAKKCQRLFSRKFHQGVSIFANIRSVLSIDGDDLSPESLTAFALNIRFTMDLAKKADLYDGSIDDELQQVVDDMYAFCTSEIRNHFIALIGRKTLDLIEKQNWISYDKRMSKTTEISINFLEKDGKQDTVSFFHLCYNFDDAKFTTEDCCSSEKDPLCDTYEEAKEHNLSKRKAIENNNFTFVELP